MLQKEPLHPLIFAFANFEIVGRIQVEERERFNRGVRVKDVALDDLVENFASFYDSIGVEFDSVSTDSAASRDRLERHTCAAARVKGLAWLQGNSDEAIDSFRFRLR
jgi:hypothetical protein